MGMLEDEIREAVDGGETLRFTSNAAPDQVSHVARMIRVAMERCNARLYDGRPVRILRVWGSGIYQVTIVPKAFDDAPAPPHV